MTEGNRVWRLRKRPNGTIADGDLSFATEAVPTPVDGELLVRVNYLSLDPTNRIWMSDIPQYLPPVGIADPMRGGICGTVVESKAPGFAKGDVVAGLGSWSDYQIMPAAMTNKMETGPLPLADAYGILSVVGPTAYFGLMDIGQPKAGETLVVSAAAGAVGSIVAQIGKIKGCRVVGLAGTEDKCAWLQKDLGLDAVINYKKQDVRDALGRACPSGIDIYFDNVGGEILDACLERMNIRGRVVTCGLISAYNEKQKPAGPRNYDMILMRRLRVEGFIIIDHFERYPEAMAALVPWMLEGRIKYRLDVVDGLENAMTACKRLYTGENKGKLMVRVS
jgi:NADPH-dependent curcumin reductase